MFPSPSHTVPRALNPSTIWPRCHPCPNTRAPATDDRGAQVMLEGKTRSSLVSDAEHRGFTVMFLVGQLRAGAGQGGDALDGAHLLGE